MFREPSPELVELAQLPDQSFLIVPEGNERATPGLAAWLSPTPCDYDFFAGDARHFPLWITTDLLEKPPSQAKRRQFRKSHAARQLNLSQQTREACVRIDAAGVEHSMTAEMALWPFLLGVLHAPSYHAIYGKALLRGWPRIPLPGWDSSRPVTREQAEQYFAIARLGSTLSRIFSGAPLPEPVKHALSPFGVLTCNHSDSGKSPGTAESMELSSSWSISARGGAIRPGRGTFEERQATENEQRLLQQAYQALALAYLPRESASNSIERTNNENDKERIVDIQLNETWTWRNVPYIAWTSTLGGYPVLRKWLSYRSQSAINRSLSPTEAACFTDIVHRLIILEYLRDAFNNPTRKPIRS